MSVFSAHAAANTSNNRIVSTNALLLDIAIAGERLVAVGERGLIFLSDDNAESWYVAQSDNTSLLTSVFFLNASTGWITGHDGSLLKTVDGGLHWQAQNSGIVEDPLFDVFFLNEKKGYAVGAFGIFLKSEDGGISWLSITISDRDSHWYVISESASGKLVIAGESGAILRFDDAGESWQQIEAPYSGSMFNSIRLHSGKLLLIGLRGNLLLSSNDGQSWQHISTPFDVSLQGGCQTLEGEIILSGAGGTLVSANSELNQFNKIKVPGYYNITQTLALNRDQVVIVGNFGAKKINLNTLQLQQK